MIFQYLIILTNLINFIKGDVIVGGEPADISLFPYQAILELHGEHACGATIIHPKILLTAAHCIRSQMSVRVGTSVQGQGGQCFKVKAYIAHECFEDKTCGNSGDDIALILLDRKIKFNDNAKMIRTATENPMTGEVGYITGYGESYGFSIYYLTHMYSMGLQLMCANIPVLSEYECRLVFGKHFKDDNICAGTENGVPNAFFGDSGGPLVVDNKLVGIVSFGVGFKYPCCFTSVVYHKEWLDLNKQRLLNM